MTNDHLLDPKHWRDRAEQTLVKAEQAWRPEARDRLLKIAREYERIAQRAEQCRLAATVQPTEPWLQGN